MDHLSGRAGDEWLRRGDFLLLREPCVESEELWFISRITLDLHCFRGRERYTTGEEEKVRPLSVSSDLLSSVIRPAETTVKER